MQEHERQCGPGGDGGAADSDTESVCSELEEAGSDQTRFLSYVGLRPAAGTGKQVSTGPRPLGKAGKIADIAGR